MVDVSSVVVVVSRENNRTLRANATSLSVSLPGDLQSCHNSPTHKDHPVWCQKTQHCQAHCDTLHPHCCHLQQSHFPTAVVLGFPSVYPKQFKFRELGFFPPLWLSLSVCPHCPAVLSPSYPHQPRRILSQFPHFHQQRAVDFQTEPDLLEAGKDDCQAP